jgi:hypothetical protein
MPENGTASRNATVTDRFGNDDFEGAQPGVESAPVLIQYFDAQLMSSGVELSWFAVSEKDIEGYRIYRRETDEAFLWLVNEDGLLAPWQVTFMDGSIARDVSYEYVLGVVHADQSEFLSYVVPVTPTRSNSSQ